MSDDPATLRARRRQVEQEIQQCQASSYDLDEQIERLNTAKRQVVGVDEAVKDVAVGVDWDVDLLRKWKGRERDRFNDEAQDDGYDALVEYSRQASDLYSHICDQITALENQRNENRGALGWLAQRLNDVQNALDKFVN